MQEVTPARLPVKRVVDAAIPILWGVVGTIIVLVFFYLAYLLFWPQDPLDITVHVDSPQPSSGPVVYESDYCKHTEATSTVYRSLVGVGRGTLTYPFPASGSGASVAQCGKARVAVAVPVSIRPGSYRLRVQIVYQLNAVRVDSVTVLSNTFTVS